MRRTSTEHEPRRAQSFFARVGRCREPHTGRPVAASAILNKLSRAQQRSTTVGRCTRPVRTRSRTYTFSRVGRDPDRHVRDHAIMAPLAPTPIRRNGDHQLICPTPQQPHTHLHHHLMPACLFDHMHQPLDACASQPPVHVHPMRHLTKRMLRNTAPRRGVSCPDPCISSACPGAQVQAQGLRLGSRIERLVERLVP